MKEGTVKAIIVVIIELINTLLLFSQLFLFGFGIMNQSIDDPLPAYYTYAHLFTFVVLIWFGAYLLKFLSLEFAVKKWLSNQCLLFPYRILLVLLGLLSLYYQSELLIFEYSKLAHGEIELVFLTILVIVWFVVHQIKLFIDSLKNTCK